LKGIAGGRDLVMETLLPLLFWVGFPILGFVLALLCAGIRNARGRRWVLGLLAAAPIASWTIGGAVLYGCTFWSDGGERCFGWGFGLVLVFFMWLLWLAAVMAAVMVRGYPRK